MKTYPKYKDSGVEWLGEIPAGWEVSAIKNVADLIMGQSPNSSECSNDPIGLPFLQGCSDFGPISPKATTYCETPRKTAHENDFLLSVRAPVGALNIANQVYGIGRGLCAIRVVHLHRDFAYHLLMLASSPLNAVATGSTYAAITVTQLANLQIPLPPLPEQRAIAAFLDHEVAKIDELIAEQERLIELLAEKRQATISHAVTKGLDPNAKLKPSGVEWLGDVPEDWEVVKLSSCFRASKGPRGQILKNEYFADHEGEYPVYSGQTENNGIMAFIDSYDFDFGDEGVLFSTTVGAKAMSVSHIFGKFSLSQNCMIISPRSVALNPAFYLYHFTHVFSYFRALIPEHMQASFRIGDLYSFVILRPPLEVQNVIAAYLANMSDAFNSLTTAAREAIALLQERRSSLISAAVTGKIDVRDFVAAEEESA